MALIAALVIVGKINAGLVLASCSESDSDVPWVCENVGPGMRQALTFLPPLAVVIAAAVPSGGRLGLWLGLAFLALHGAFVLALGIAVSD